MEYSYKGTNIYMDFSDYKKWEECFNSKLCIKNKYMDIKIKSLCLQTIELESLREFITEFLEGKIKKEEKIEFAEPDIEMHFFPKTNDNEMYMILLVDLASINTAPYSMSFIKIKLDKGFIEELKKYIEDVCSLKYIK